MYIQTERNKRGGVVGMVTGMILLVGMLPAQAAILDVCPAGCTDADLEVVLAAAAPGDTIILAGPGAAPPAVQTYTLTTTMVIGAALDGITIRGASDSRPDQIEISYAGGPVIQVDTDTEFTIEGVTIKDGTTGVLAMAGSDVSITRCLIDNIGGIGVDCIGVAPDGVDSVTLKSTVITNCTGEATRIDIGGTLNLSQCTLLTNGSFGVNAIAGEAHVEATLIHDSDDGTSGMSGTVTTLFPVANWVTNLAGVDLPLPAGVTDPDAILLDPLVPALVFSPGGFPGQLLDATQERQTGLASNDAKFSISPASRDFNMTNRVTADIIVGADEVTGGGGPAAGWSECYISQNGEVRLHVGEGTIRVELVTIGIGLDGASIYIEHDSGAVVDVFTENMGPFAIQTSAVDTNYGFVDIPILEGDFPIAFPTPTDHQVPYLLYIETADVNGVPDAGNLNGLPSGSNPELFPFGGSRIFELDTIPPTLVLQPDRLADQYLSPDPFNDGVANAGGKPLFWDPANLLPGDLIGANAGYLNYQGIDPQVFFNSPSSAAMGFIVSVIFQDINGSGFETVGMPFTASASTPVGKEDVLYFDYAGTDGFAWWERNSESQRELIDSNVQVDVTYTTTPSGEQLTVDWSFSNVTHNPLVLGPSAAQWHALANIRVRDKAGNEATLDPTFQANIPLKPLHFWWFPVEEAGVFPGVIARIKSGPSGGSDADPRFTWGINRLLSGKDPADPAPVSTAASWRVYRADTPGVEFTSWQDITGGWSDWLHPVFNGTITLDTVFDFSTGTTMRDIITATGVQGDEYLLALIGYDEAGNSQVGLGNGPVVDYTVFDSNLIAYNRWTDPGASLSLGVETQVRATFWHNNTDTIDYDGDGTPDIEQINADERVFGQVSRIPLSDTLCQRVEAGFEVAMGLPDVLGATPFVEFVIFEDGLKVASGTFTQPPPSEFLAIPEHLINPPAWLTLGAPFPTEAFLNFAPLNPLTGFTADCDTDGNSDKDRLGDDGDSTAEPGFRRRDVKYVVQFTTHAPAFNALGVLIDAPDLTPATVEFTVTARSGAPKSADQAIKSFKRE